MSDIRTKPVTPEYEESWNRVFGKEKMPDKVFVPTGIIDEQLIKDVKALCGEDTEIIPIL